MLVLRNARLIPQLVEGFEGQTGDVIVENGVIQEIKPARTAKAASEQDIIDLTGKTLMPG